MTYRQPVAGAASADLAIVAREMADIVDRVTDAATAARSLAAATNWQAKAATAFYNRAEVWVGQVSSLVGLAESARVDAEHARDRALLREADAYAQLFAPADAR